jgi:hypothetical protein
VFTGSVCSARQGLDYSYERKALSKWAKDKACIRARIQHDTVGGSAHVVLLSTRVLSKETCARRAQGPQLCPYLRWLHEHE